MRSISIIKALSNISIFFVAAIVFLILVGESRAATTSALLPVSDGNYLQWSPNSGAIHFNRVDEASCNGNTDFNRETTVGGRDSYGLNISSVPNGATITQIDITPCASKNTSGGTNTTFNVFYRLDGVDSADAGAYSLTTTTPAGLGTTSYSGLSALKSGSTTLQIGGVFTAGNRGAKLSQISAVITYIIPPSATTSAATGITQTGATLNSTINPNGISTTANFLYGTSNVGCSSLPNATGSVGVGSGTSGVSNPIAIASLSANTTYYFCATATSSAGTTYGSVRSFVTLPNPPSVTTEAAFNINQTTASVSATINPNGASTFVSYRYGTSNVGCSSLPSVRNFGFVGSGSSPIVHTGGLPSLTANTTYYYCGVANNTGGTTYGDVLSFTTLP